MIWQFGDQLIYVIVGDQQAQTKQSSRKHLDNNLQHSNIFHYFEQILFTKIGREIGSIKWVTFSS